MVTVKVCPKCGSENVRIDTDNKKAAFGLAVPSYVCLDCRFSGAIFPEIEKEMPSADAAKKERQKKP